MRAPTFIILPFLVNITLASVNSPDEDPGTFNNRPNSIIETSSSSSSSNFHQESGNDIFEDQSINKVGKKDSSFRDKGKDKETMEPLINSTLKERPIIPIFVMGSPRSGTTLIGNYIGSCDKVYNLIEYPGFCAAADLVPNYQSRVYASYKPSYHRSLFKHAKSFAKTKARKMGYEAYVDSNPFNLTIIEKLRGKIYPAIFIIMLRDYRGVISSLEKSYNNPPGRLWPGKDDEARARLYCNLYENLMNISPEEVIYLNYDQLFINPNETLNEFDKNFYTKLTTLFNIQNPQDKWVLSRKVFGDHHAPNIRSSSSSTSTSPKRFFKVEGLGKEVNLTPLTGPYNENEWSAERDEKVKEEIGKLVCTFKKEKPYASLARLEKDPAFVAFYMALEDLQSRTKVLARALTPAVQEEETQEDRGHSRSFIQRYRLPTILKVGGALIVALFIVVGVITGGICFYFASPGLPSADVPPLFTNHSVAITQSYSKEYCPTNEILLWQNSTVNLPEEAENLGRIKRNTGKYVDKYSIKNKKAHKQASIPFIWKVPLHNSNFIGRTDFLESLHATLVNTSTNSPYVAVTGLPGMGKTQVAKKYANLYQDQYDLIWWFDGTLDLNKQYEDLALVINDKLEFWNQGVGQPLKLTKITTSFPQRVIDALRLTQRNWLLIYDNVKTEADIKQYIPEKHEFSSFAHIIATSKNSAGWKCLLKLEVFTRNESLELLKQITAIEDKLNADKLAGLLGDYPLAIAQAGAYIQMRSFSSPMDFQDYIKLHINKRRELGKREEDLRETQGHTAYDDYEFTVATTLEPAMEEIRGHSESALDLLTLCTFINKGNIPEELLRNWTIYKGGDPDFSFDEAITPLVSYSILEKEKGKIFHHESNTYSLHGLVQRVIRDKILFPTPVGFTKLTGPESIEEICEFLVTKADILPKADLDAYEDPKKKLDYLPHIAALIQHSKRLQMECQACDQVQWIGRILYLIGMRKCGIITRTIPQASHKFLEDCTRIYDQEKILFGIFLQKGKLESLNELLDIVNTNHPAVQSVLGLIFAGDLLIDSNHQESFKWYYKAAEQGYAEAQFHLAVMYSQGQGIPRNDTAAIKWCHEAAEQGHPEAQFELGKIYHAGQRALQDYEKAVQWFQAASEQGDIEAQYYLASMYSQGQGVAQDDNTTIKWYLKSAEQDYIKSQFELGKIYYAGQRAPQDYKKAAQWFQKAAERGHIEAQALIGMMYAEGQGVTQDYEKALIWFHKSAEQGYVEAQFHLGIIYYVGQGIPASYVEAMKWFQKAAEQGHIKAQYIFTRMYEEGYRVD